MNVVYVPYNFSSDRKGVDVYYLNGTRIGYFEIENDVVVETGMANENNDGQTTSNLAAATSWWACTRECISDAHIACYGDSQCMTLLLISNAPSGTGASGLGSASIAIACGAVCAKNRETDLIVD